MPSSSDLMSAKGNESRDRLGGAEEAGGRRASVIANRPVMPFDVTCSRPTFRCFFQLPLRCQVNSQQYSGSRLEGVNIGNTASLSGFVAATTVVAAAAAATPPPSTPPSAHVLYAGHGRVQSRGRGIVRPRHRLTSDRKHTGISTRVLMYTGATSSWSRTV